VKIPANSSATLKLEESTPIKKSVDIRTSAGVAELKLYLTAAAARLEPGTRAALEQVVELHRQMAALQEKRETAELQSQTYRVRIDELNAQLVSLRRVTQAQSLSRNLAQKMDEISQRLQKLTLEVADIDGQILAQRVTLEDRLAELTLGKSSALASK
jgi:chromosome segregation ATPase